MRIYVDSAILSEIEEWDAHPWVSGFTTNPTLLRATQYADAMAWAERVTTLTKKPVSIDGPHSVWTLGTHVWRKVKTWIDPEQRPTGYRINHTAVCRAGQIDPVHEYLKDDIISVFAGRIMDTGRDPQRTIDRAKATGAQVLWASVREPYNIVQAEAAGCNIVTVPPAILRKWLDWAGKPLEVVAEETVAQFERDAKGLW